MCRNLTTVEADCAARISLIQGRANCRRPHLQLKHVGIPCDPPLRLALATKVTRCFQPSIVALMRKSHLLAVGIFVFAMLQSAAAQLVQVRHASGQGVAPVYEGYDVNPDGSFNMWFGYMNRNYEEELDVPVGPDNHFEPGVDRGQPTHFIVRRHKDVFKVVVPKDFGDQKLEWALTAHGQTARVSGTLNPVWLIDRLRTTRGGNSEKINSNTPPQVVVQPFEASIAEPGSVTFNLLATDDGLPERGGKPVGMTALWSKYRGPGTVRFEPARSRVTDGRAVMTAIFSEPGEYILQAVVDDGSGEVAGNFGYHCCWTNAQVKVTIGGRAPTNDAHLSSSAVQAVTFSKDVAPILQRACQSCHHAGSG